MYAHMTHQVDIARVRQLSYELWSIHTYIHVYMTQVGRPIKVILQGSDNYHMNLEHTYILTYMYT